jgi:integrase
VSIRKWGNGWQVRVRPFPEISVPTKAAAETVELDLKLRRKLGNLYVEKPTTLGEELERHLQRKETLGGRRGKLRPRSLEFVKQNVAPWKPLCDVPVPNLRRAVVEDHVLARAAAAPVAARNELQELKAALRAAQSRGQQVDPGILAIDPIHHEPAEGRALEPDELDRIAAWLPERVKRIVPFCGTIGLRWSEAVKLDDAMVDLAFGEIVIPKWLDKSRRGKPIPLAACEVQLLREQSMVRPAGTSLLFPNAEGCVYSKSGFRSVAARAT